jgi:oligoribonuclease NrnB/cAMP/cGMP phosphodiesterase (DHH superfamily)
LVEISEEVLGLLTNSWGKIVTHTDFDGVVSAAICSRCLGINGVSFAGPRAISENLISVSERDVVCDLPYPLRCGLWFDHHPGNLEELRLRGHDPGQIPGRFDLKDSCGRVVLDYFSSMSELPAYFEATVHHADIIDAFKYHDIDDWRIETPSKVIDCALKMAGSARSGDPLRRKLVFLLRDNPLEAVASSPEIRERYDVYKGQEDAMISIIREASFFLPEDHERELIIVDLTRYKKRPFVLKNLAFLLYPSAQGVVEIRSLYSQGIKTNNLGLSISFSPNVDSLDNHRDLGEIMRELNLGDGHKGAAGGTLNCRSRDEMIRRKKDLLGRILRLWGAA